MAVRTARLGSGVSGRARGRRLPYLHAPEAVRAWVNIALGSPVVRAEDQTGGFSPGCAARLECADGSRAFVKAVGASLNPDSPVLFRREVQALELLGRDPLWAALLDSYDDGDWVALLLEDVEGRHPDVADDATMDRLLAATEEVARVMAERVPNPPPPGPPETHDAALFRPGPVDLQAVFAEWLESLDRLEEVPDDLCPAWLRAEAATLRPGVSALTSVPADHVVHFDIRDDNLLQRPTGEIVFLDWGAFGVGPAWLDPLLARLERVDRAWFDTSLASSPALVRAGDDVVTAWLVGIGAHLALRAAVVVDVNLPTLGAFRRQESARFLDAARRRLGA